MALVQSVGISSSNASFVLATLNGVAGGNFLTLLNSVYITGAPPNNTPSDSVGNTWNTTTAPTPHDDTNAFINYAMNVGAQDTIVTIDYGTTFAIDAVFAEYSGIATASALDVQTANDSAGSTTPTSGTTASTAQADELVLTCLAIGTLVNPVGIDAATTGYTNLFVQQDNNAHVGASGDYKIVSAAGAQSAAWGTLNGSYSWSAKIATFKTPSGAITGTSANVFGAGSSTLTGAGALAGSSANVFGAGSSALAGSGALAGSSADTFGAGSSTLLGAGALAGSGALTFGGTNTLSGAGALAGSSALVFDATLTVSSSDIAGVGALNFAGLGALTGAGALAGVSALAFDATAVLIDIAAPEPAAHGSSGGKATKGRRKIGRVIRDDLDISAELALDALSKSETAAIEVAVEPVEVAPVAQSIDTRADLSLSLSVSNLLARDYRVLEKGAELIKERSQLAARLEDDAVALIIILSEA